MMDVITDPNYGKDTRGDFKGKMYMQSSEGIILGEDTKLQMELQRAIEVENAKKQIILAVQEHNTMITNPEPLYNTMAPLNRQVLVKLFREPVTTASGVFKAKVLPVPKRSGLDGPSSEYSENPFPFLNLGIVVSSDSPSVSPGQFVQVIPEVVYPTFNKEIWMWTPPRVSFTFYDEPIKGYVLLREMDIQAIVPESSLNFLLYGYTREESNQADSSN